MNAERTPAELEQRSQELRTEIDLILDEIAARLAPEHLGRVAADRVRRSGIGLTVMTIRAVQRRPKMVAAAAGIAAVAVAGTLLRRWRNGKRR